jgi:hypothetical protein
MKMTESSRHGCGVPLHQYIWRVLTLLACAVPIVVVSQEASADLAACRSNLQACVAAQSSVVHDCVQQAVGGISADTARAAAERCLSNAAQVRQCVRVAAIALQDNPAMQSALLQCASGANTSVQGCRSAFGNCRSALAQ